MTQRVHSYNLLLVAPLRKGSYVRCGLGVGEVWFVVHVEVLAGYSECVVDAVRASVGTDSCT